MIQLLLRTKLRELTQSVFLLAESEQNTDDPSKMLKLLQCIIDRILAQIEILLNCVFKPFSANWELFM